jgi:hypothetical protein
MGQINPETQFGAFLKKIAGEPGVHSIVDIGAWNGLGSTRCLMEGIKDRTDAHVYSYENKKEFWEVASRNWTGNDKVSVIYGRLTDRLMTRVEIEGHRNFPFVDEHYKLWYDDDVKCFMESPLVSPPDTIDFVVIDGGEFSTQGDWDVVSKYTPKYIALDDTHVIKCSDIEVELDANPSYEKIGSGTDRNGWAIFKLKQ